MTQHEMMIGLIDALKRRVEKEKQNDNFTFKDFSVLLLGTAERILVVEEIDEMINGA